MQSQLKCSSGNIAIYVCVSKNCQQHAFICDSIQCCTKQKHNGCNIQLLDNFCSIQPAGDKQFHFYAKKYQFFIITYQKLQKVIDNSQDNGLEFTTKFIKIFWNKKNRKQRSPSLACKLTNSTNLGHALLHNILSKTENNISKDLNLIKKILIQNSKRVEDQRRSLTTQYVQIDSKILWKDQDQKTLLRFFGNENKIKQINCLYRASNFDFSVAKFHQRCDGIPNTLTVIRNSKNIIYGGFSAPSWEQDQIGKYKPDNLGKSFVFSITHDQKFILHEKEYAIQCNKFCGPRFGKVSVISIYDKADSDNAYWHILPESYHHPNEPWTQKSYEHFLGVQMYEKYTLNQWEIFQVIFEP